MQNLMYLFKKKWLMIRVQKKSVDLHEKLPIYRFKEKLSITECTKKKIQ